MELDDLQTLWTTHHRQLEQRLVLNESALRTMMVERTERGLNWKLVSRVAGVVVDLVLIVALCIFAWQQRSAPPFVLSAAVVVAFIVAVGGQGLRQVVLIGRLDLCGPVTTSQRILAQLAMAEYRAIKWVMLLAILVWVPILAIVLKAVAGVDLFALASVAWVLTNIGLGVAVLVLGQWLSRRYVERSDLGPRARWVVEFVAGTKMARLKAQLEELAQIEHEPR